MSALTGDPDTLRRLAAAGIETEADVQAKAELVRDLPERTNLVLALDDATWFVKVEKRGRRRRRSLPREADGAARLAAAGVPIAPVAFHGTRLTGTVSLAPSVPLDDLLRDGVDADGRRRLARALAQTAAALHAAGLHHKDLYLNHCFGEAGTAEPVVRLIDLERVKRHRRALGRWVVKDLAALRHSIPEGTVPEAEQTRFLARYLALRGIPRKGVLPGLARRVRAKARRIGRRLPKTPVGSAARPA